MLESGTMRNGTSSEELAMSTTSHQPATATVTAPSLPKEPIAASPTIVQVVAPTDLVAGYELMVDVGGETVCVRIVSVRTVGVVRSPFGRLVTV